MAIRARFDLFTAGLCASRDGFTGANASSHWIRLALDRIIRWLAHTLGIFVLQIKNCGPNGYRTINCNPHHCLFQKFSYGLIPSKIPSGRARLPHLWAVFENKRCAMSV